MVGSLEDIVRSLEDIEGSLRTQCRELFPE